MADTVRTPQQQRSIDKKNRIIEAGYTLFAEKGYFSTNTAEIAKAAGVSTGIVYGYFRDKRDVLLDAMEIYIGNVFSPLFGLLEAPVALDFKHIAEEAVTLAVKAHKENAAMHETLHSLATTDEAVAARFSSLEAEMTKAISARLVALGYKGDKLYEKVHTAIMLVQAFAHEIVYDNHCYINYQDMQMLVVKTLVNIFTNEK